jgi:hypothetical protein
MFWVFPMYGKKFVDFPLQNIYKNKILKKHNQGREGTEQYTNTRNLYKIKDLKFGAILEDFHYIIPVWKVKNV